MITHVAAQMWLGCLKQKTIPWFESIFLTTDLILHIAFLTVDELLSRVSERLGGGNDSRPQGHQEGLHLLRGESTAQAVHGDATSLRSHTPIPAHPNGRLCIPCVEQTGYWNAERPSQAMQRRHGRRALISLYATDSIDGKSALFGEGSERKPSKLSNRSDSFAHLRSVIPVQNNNS